MLRRIGSSKKQWGQTPNPLTDEENGRILRLEPVE